MPWTTMNLQVTTPLFNGGADSDHAVQDDETGIRVASVRGAMRFWFRALAGCLIGPDLGMLAAVERRIFGGIVRESAGQPEGATPSPLLLRIPEQPAVLPPGARRDWLPPPGHRNDDRKWIIYLLGQGLGDLASNTLRRPCVEPGETFTLRIGFRHAAHDDAATRTAIETLALASLWLTCAYGGVGARTRRGFGGLRITGADGPLPGPWQEADAVLSPDLGHYAKLSHIWPAGPLQGCMRYFRALAPHGELNPRTAWGDALPSFPVMSLDRTRAGLSRDDYDDWVDALSVAGYELRHFRANADNPGARYSPDVETAEWKNTVHGPSQGFSLGALGLPVGYRDGYVVNATGPGHEQLRRSSPLWLRVVGTGDRKRLLSFAFHTQFLPEPDEVRVWRRGGLTGKGPLVVDPGDVKRVTDQWIGTLAGGGTFTTRDHRRV